MTEPSTPVAGAALPLQPAIDLQRLLLWGSALLVLALVLLLGAWQGWLLREAAEDALPATARLVARALHDDLARQDEPHDRYRPRVNLQALDELAQRAPLCVTVRSLQTHVLGEACAAAQPAGPLATWLGQRLRALAPEAQVELPLLLPAGIKAGLVEVRVHWDDVGRAWQQQWLWLALAGALVAAAAAALQWPLRRALAPSQQVLAAVQRLAAGELSVRVPPPRLAQLRGMAAAVNDLAARWAALQQAQQALAQRLLDVREEERRRLARELHDELGQGLTAIRAEAALAQALLERAAPAAAQAHPLLRDSAGRIARLGAAQLEGLQRVLADLRPAALDRFGLAAALQALAAEPLRRADGGLLAVQLQLPAVGLAAVPAAMAVHVFRIAQEGLTNAARHAQAQRVWLRLDLQARPDAAPALQLTVDDDGRGPGAQPPQPGHGLLGMAERVRALRGRLHWGSGPDGGLRLAVWLPLDAAGGPS